MIERIYIPTVRRADNQITFNNLPKELQERVVMVVEPGERHLYDYPCEYLEIPEKLVGTWTQLAETRLFIHKHAGAIKYCVADDDIKIRRRNAKYWTGQSNMEKSKRDATAEEMLDMYETVDKWFDERAIGVVGLSDAGTPPASNEYEDYDAMRYIQSKYPHGVKIFEKDGKMKNRKYWKKVYNPKYENTLEDFMS